MVSIQPPIAPVSCAVLAARPASVVRAFQKLGWEVARQRGSHIILTKPGDLASLSIPNHPQVASGTLRSVITKAGLTIEEFVEALKG